MRFSKFLDAIYSLTQPIRRAFVGGGDNCTSCCLVFALLIYFQFPIRSGGQVVDYQFIRRPFHLLHFEEGDQAQFQRWLCAAMRLARMTFISFPPADNVLDRDRVVNVFFLIYKWGKK